jgi:hypothetical protein
VSAIVGIWLLVIVTSIWVAVDASNIGARRGLIKGLGDMGPAGWFFCCLLVWIVGVPVYLAKRSEIKAAAALIVATSTPSDVAQLSQPPLTQRASCSHPNPTAQGDQHDWSRTGSAKASKADELAKLAALRGSGVLTQEEFDVEKAKLLAAP